MKKMIFAFLAVLYVLSFFVFSYILVHYCCNIIPVVPFIMICIIFGFTYGYTILDVMLYLYKKAAVIASER